MDLTCFIGVVLVGIGTFFLRYLPLKAGLSRPAKKKNGKDVWSEILEVSGISIIAALLVSSVEFPGKGENLNYLINVIISSGLVILTCFIWKNPGVSVICGIACFAALGFII